MENTEKWYTIIKIGYTAGVYGCSGEYFNLIINPSVDKWTTGIFFQGMYGTEQRIGELMKDAGYTEKYTQSVYGQLKRKDIPKGRFLGEYEAIAKVKELLAV